MVIKGFRFLSLLALLLLFSGCVNLGEIPSDEEKKGSFAAYAEKVFRRQNNATSIVMTLSPDELDDATEYEALLNAEKNMQNACQLLNDYAQRSQEGENPDVLFRSRVGIAVKDCDHATQRLEILLDDFDLR
ncbi:MAG: hypothetical protein ACU837_02305 [Gammaproteobacteria bacterium]